jgi:erythromycin esterase-like protein
MNLMKSITRGMVSDYTLLSGSRLDYEPLLNMIGNAKIVLIGEASHGTHEFYRERSRITRELIDSNGFSAVAVEADWPDAYRVNRYVRGFGNDRNADESLRDFKRFPSWMWRNTDVVSFVDWLRARNASQRFEQMKVGFYGLDLYSLRASMEAVVNYLETVDPQAAAEARHRYSCFDIFESEGQRYGHGVMLNVAAPCENEVIEQLNELRDRQEKILSRDGWLAADEFFYAERNAQLVLNAERYYRTMYRGHISSWNLRDTHMVETLVALKSHLQQDGAESRMVVWAHNSHVGDARATEMSHRGEINVGQLARELWPGEVFIIGFTTHHGRVTAASEWGAPAERKRVRPSLPGSYEDAFHSMQEHSMIIPTRSPANDSLADARLERAIGVIYRPETERTSHWFHSNIREQFDAVIHIDSTSALRPLERNSMWDLGEPPETYPSGL